MRLLELSCLDPRSFCLWCHPNPKCLVKLCWTCRLVRFAAADFCGKYGKW